VGSIKLFSRPPPDPWSADYVRLKGTTSLNFCLFFFLLFYLFVFLDLLIKNNKVKPLLSKKFDNKQRQLKIIKTAQPTNQLEKTCPLAKGRF
jgi:hypothetical protein